MTQIRLNRSELERKEIVSRMETYLKNESAGICTIDNESANESANESFDGVELVVFPNKEFDSEKGEKDAFDMFQSLNVLNEIIKSIDNPMTEENKNNSSNMLTIINVNFLNADNKNRYMTLRSGTSYIVNRRYVEELMKEKFGDEFKKLVDFTQYKIDISSNHGYQTTIESISSNIPSDWRF